uniref:hypothetical protein n=1 Tax=Thaumasiovibrio occultus TaxID=1891184 RepID=UPI000B35715F|nr:hypothetical protein [Thaumasiovibrio occultus]
MKRRLISICLACALASGCASLTADRSEIQGDDVVGQDIALFQYALSHDSRDSEAAFERLVLKYYAQGEWGKAAYITEYAGDEWGWSDDDYSSNGLARFWSLLLGHDIPLLMDGFHTEDDISSRIQALGDQQAEFEQVMKQGDMYTFWYEHDIDQNEAFTRLVYHGDLFLASLVAAGMVDATERGAAFNILMHSLARYPEQAERVISIMNIAAASHRNWDFQILSPLKVFPESPAAKAYEEWHIHHLREYLRSHEILEQLSSRHYVLIVYPQLNRLIESYVLLGRDDEALILLDDAVEQALLANPKELVLLEFYRQYAMLGRGNEVEEQGLQSEMLKDWQSDQSVFAIRLYIALQQALKADSQRDAAEILERALSSPLVATERTVEIEAVLNDLWLAESLGQIELTENHRALLVRVYQNLTASDYPRNIFEDMDFAEFNAADGKP